MSRLDAAPVPSRHEPISAQMVRECQEDDAWSLGNEVLYELCRSYPAHSSVGEVVAKVWLIGRSYSATVERGRGDAAGPGLTNDAFYTQAVAPALIASGMDVRLRELADIRQITVATAGPALEAHALLVTLLAKLTGKSKRSFASKYLHFHQPQIFFIYDARACEAIGKLGLRRRRVARIAGVDAEYAAFVAALLALRDRIVDQFGVALSPRQLDRLLLMIAPA